jgi:ligand-binding SRPBCC domain-containing protein
VNQVFTAEQFVPVPREQVFAFFSTPRNLEAITPPWLKFRIVHESAPQPGEGVEYTYRLRMRGIPMTWKSRLTEWSLGERFVDIQLQGPYAEWHHTHIFEDAEGGTRILDRVSYRLPLGWFGRFFGGRMVAADIRKIFGHRKEKTAELLMPEGQSDWRVGPCVTGCNSDRSPDPHG